jgi:hypothetical protein
MLAKRCFFMGIITLLSVSLAMAQDPPAVHPVTEEPLVIECFRGTPAAIDGDLSDWSLGAMTPAVLDTEEQIYPGAAQGAAAWDGPEDSSGKFYLLWDDVNIYIAVVMKDDVLSQNKTGGDIWNADGVEVFFSTLNAVTGHEEHYQYGFDFKEQTWNWCNMDGPGQSAIDYVQAASTETDDGYICEVAIEHGQMLSLDFEVGNTIGFHPVFDDTDIDDSDRELQMTWTGREAHDQSLGFGHIFLSDASVIPGPSSNPSPANGAIDQSMGASLSWWPGDFAVSRDVYFGENFDDVNEASRTDPRGVLVSQDQKGTIYEPTSFLEFAQTYYWRVDEFNDAEPNSPWKGNTWTFTVIDHFVVEDFEDYNDYSPDMIFETWFDGYEVPTNGALVGHDADFSRGEHIVETTVFHGGKQSMPYYYDNVGTATYSEAECAFSPAQDWTREGVGVLSLWFRGHPAYMGGFVEGPTGTYTMTGEGADIWGNSDQFHFAWKEFSGAGSIVAKVESVSETDPWAKAGVMIRDTLDADSRHAMMVVTPTSGVSFQRRRTAGSTSSDDTEAGIPAPQWVKLERTIAGLIRAYYSADGSTWTQLGMAQTVTMNSPMYIGLALTSHNSGVGCEARFSNVTSDGTGQWADEDIGLVSNEAEPMYVTVKDGSGTAATVYNDDPDASLISTWTQWHVDLKGVGDAGVVLTDVSNLAIGFGSADDPQPGGSGLMFFDDIRLYRSAEQVP